MQWPNQLDMIWAKRITTFGGIWITIKQNCQEKEVNETIFYSHCDAGKRVDMINRIANEGGMVIAPHKAAK